MKSAATAQVVVIGSGAGGATVALTLAEAGLDVLVLEEGRRVPGAEYGGDATDGMRRFYRRRGMTPIMGRVPMGYVEGACLGGSTEVNSGFWHRTATETLHRWRAQFDLADAQPETLAPHFDWAEDLLGVSVQGEAHWPRSTQLFAQGAQRMGWSAHEVPRTAPGCRGANRCANGCPTGAKQGMTAAVLPRAGAAGARVVTGARVLYLLRRRTRVTSVIARIGDRLVQIDAETVFVCAGPSETPALLRRSGFRGHVGNSLRVHPMLKVVARFDERVDAQDSVLPLVQVKEFAPDISFGGGFFSPGHLALVLSANWAHNGRHIQDHRSLATYYVAVRGTGNGTVRPSLTPAGHTRIRYELSADDETRLSQGLGRLSALLLAAGAEEVYPAVHGLPRIADMKTAMRYVDEPLDRSAMSLTTVHAFSSCPIGERRDRCVADSGGKVWDTDNLYISDASTVPDSPGTNPQGTVMAFARRNALRFAAAR